jgi:chromosome segregation ATPase
MRILIFAIIAVAMACTSTGAGSAVLEHQRQVDELEARNQDLERRLAQYNDVVGRGVAELEAVRTRSIGLEGEVDEIIDLFEQYQRGVEQLTRAYNELRATAAD